MLLVQPSEWAEVHRELHALTAKVTGFDTKFGDLTAKVERLDMKFDGLDTKFERLNTKVEGLDMKFDRKFEDFRVQVDNKFSEVDVQFRDLHVQVALVLAKTADIDVLREAVVDHTAQLRSLLWVRAPAQWLSNGPQL
eukprot:TRINITY_DN779_c0_g2_i4.p2 TRINITY_DN779_c0_g2~~TRINITY_DN779_c0_g2_i4.p2  ORF type:complete len:138 (-),score=30.06 TRINITY_DN779_c0_g2_i4:658-1071(-)